jgi:hypothetical protein
MKSKRKSLVSGTPGKGQKMTIPATEESSSSWTIHRTTAVAILLIAVFVMGMMTAFFLCVSAIHCPVVQEPSCAVFEQRDATLYATADPESTSLFRGDSSNFTSTDPVLNRNPSSSSISSSLSVSPDKDSAGGSSFYQCSKDKNTWGTLLVEILKVVWRLGALVMSVAIGYTSHHDMKSLGQSWRVFYKAMACSLLSFGITPVWSIILPTMASLMIRMASWLLEHAMIVLYHAAGWMEHYKVVGAVSFLLRLNALAGAIVLAYFSLRHSRDWLQLLLAFTVFVTLIMYGSTLLVDEGEEEYLHHRLCDNVE